MEKENPIKITIEREDDEKLELTTSRDSSLEDWEHNFRIILKWITFSDELINRMFGRDEYGEDYRE